MYKTSLVLDKPGIQQASSTRKPLASPNKKVIDEMYEDANKVLSDLFGDFPEIQTVLLDKPKIQQANSTRKPLVSPNKKVIDEIYEDANKVLSDLFEGFPEIQ